MLPLSSQKIDQYHEQGFLIPEVRLSLDRLRLLRDALERVIAANPETRPEQIGSPHVLNGKGKDETGDAAFLEIARDEKILDLVEQIIGADIVLWGSQAFCKPQGDGMEVPWHQDGQFWPINPLATCTVWIALDDSLIENGCLRVIPGSHREKILYQHLKEERSHIALHQQIDSGVFDPSSAIDVELEAGQMSFHDVYLIHGSNPNRSPRRRAGYAIRYMPGSSLFDRSRVLSNSNYQNDFVSRPLWLLRGQDRTGQNDFLIGHS